MKNYQPVIVRKDIDDEHYYYVDGKFFPAVTKILSETEPMPYGLRKWIGDVGNERAEQKRDRAAARGSYLHEICERLLNGDTIAVNDEIPDAKDRDVIVSGFVNWMRSQDLKIPAVSAIFDGPQYEDLHVPTTELTVAFDSKVPSCYRDIFPDARIQFAGTLDIFCYLDNEPYILDIKTGSGIHDEHFLQLTAYQGAFWKMTGIKANRGILHLTPRAKDKIKFYQEKDIKIAKRPVVFADWTISYMKYLSLNGGVVPEPPEINIYPDEVTLWGREDEEDPGEVEEGTGRTD